MNDFELELKAALARKEPSKGFAERTVSRTRPPRRWLPMAIAASLVVCLGAIRVHEVRQAERARDELMLALQITSKTIDKVQRVAERKLAERNTQ